VKRKARRCVPPVRPRREPSRCASVRRFTDGATSETVTANMPYVSETDREIWALLGCRLRFVGVDSRVMEMSVSAFEARFLDFLLGRSENRPLDELSESHIESMKDRIAAKYHMGNRLSVSWNQDWPILEACECSTPFCEFDCDSELDCAKLPSCTNRGVCSCWVEL
jgi:hypothetical protein